MDLEVSTWIEVHQSLSTHRKTLVLCDSLGIEPVQAVGHLTVFWQWAVDNAPHGHLIRVGARAIAIASQWRGDPQVFTGALVEAGFLDDQDGQLSIHNWERYMGRLIDARERNAERMRNARAAHVSRTSETREATKDARVGLPYPTVPNPTVPNLNTPDSAESGDPLSRAHSFLDFSELMRQERSNKPAILAKAIEEVFGIGCKEFGRVGKMAAGSPGELLKLVFTCAPLWNGIDDPLDYLTKAMQNKGQANGSGLARQARTTYEPSIRKAPMTEAEIAESFREQEEMVARLKASGAPGAHPIQ